MTLWTILNRGSKIRRLTRHNGSDGRSIAFYFDRDGNEGFGE